MGIFKVPIEVGDPAAQTFEQIEATVDTGATNTMLPATLLRKLGVSPYKKSVFELGDGRQVDLSWVAHGSKSTASRNLRR
jgi:aspartyl protease family protein